MEGYEVFVLIDLFVACLSLDSIYIFRILVLNAFEKYIYIKDLGLLRIWLLRKK